MASSKLVIKPLDRPNLFFNKFEYRVIVTGVPSVRWVHKCPTITEYAALIDEKYKVWDDTMQRYPNSYWYRTPAKSTDLDLVKVETIIDLIRQYNDKSVVTYRNENDNLSVYTTDLKIAEIFANKLSIGSITQVNTMPTGVMLFKRQPPAKYRAYTTSNKMPPDFKEQFVAYLERTPNVRPSSAFEHYFTRRYSYLWDKYYVDYDDEKNLMMMMLMFPGLIGKKYKLEKK